jgi:hypothetical protein
MTDVDHPPRLDPAISHLISKHAHVLLDTLAYLTMHIEDGHQPWAEYDNGNAADPKATATGDRGLLATADRVLTVVVEATPEGVLVPVAASLSTRPDAARDDERGRAPRITVDPGGVTLAAPRPAEATVADLHGGALTDSHADGSPS